MKKTKAMKALLKALLASYNSYIKNKKRLNSERSSAFFLQGKRVRKALPLNMWMLFVLL